MDEHEQDPTELADQLERDANRLEHGAEELGEKIDHLRNESEPKRDGDADADSDSDADAS